MEKHNINFTKLVETLRWNGKEYKGSIMDEDDKKLYCDAADAIERLQAENDELRAEKDGAERNEKDFFLKLLFATDEQIAELRDEARRQVRDLIILGEEQPDDAIRPN